MSLLRLGRVDSSSWCGFNLVSWLGVLQHLRLSVVAFMLSSLLSSCQSGFTCSVLSDHQNGSKECPFFSMLSSHCAHRFHVPANTASKYPTVQAPRLDPDHHSTSPQPVPHHHGISVINAHACPEWTITVDSHLTCPPISENGLALQDVTLKATSSHYR